ncbi:tol-pal system YbgF family protein [Bacteroidota bacterium]
MSKKKTQQSSEQLEAVESALSRSEQFIEENQKVITIVVLSILGAVALFMGIKRYYINPLENEAQSQMFVAEQYFEADSFDLALYGDGNYFGFVDIIDEYGITKSGNLAKYYTGISYLRLGEYEDAISYLKKFNAKDKIVGAIKYGSMGDAYMELGDISKAIKLYNQASEYNKNEFTSPIYLMKAGYAYESLGDYKSALKAYQIIKEEYPESSEGRNIEKYITRAELNL